jgi:hypothetical protein
MEVDCFVLSEYLETGSTKVFIPWYVSVIMTSLSVGVFIYLCTLTTDIYKNIEEEAIKAIDE